jgi:hypothetical protein
MSNGNSAKFVRHEQQQAKEEKATTATTHPVSECECR